MIITSQNKEKFKTFLMEMFQFDQSDLDFGIYKIMNQKREIISNFMNIDLFQKIEKSLEVFKKNTNQEKISKIRENIKTLEDMNEDGELTKKINTLKEEENKYKFEIDITTIEEEVYSYLLDFFSRYYDDGDFISQRRYKDGFYSIPYEGEEIKFYWANSDQYYIKSSEYFTNYIFNFKEKKIHFKLIDIEIDKDNNKGKNKFFKLFNLEKSANRSNLNIISNPEIINNELFIYFEYSEDEIKKTQSKRNEEIFESLQKYVNDNNLLEFIPLFSKYNDKTTPELLKQLNKYTSRNTSDYFIHKDLENFLTRELNFYIKNEIFQLENIDIDNIEKIKLSILKTKIIEDIAKVIIKLLAQIENFQKNLWEKKKFIVETNYCITLNNIETKFYEQILKNSEQINEWEQNFYINEIEGNYDKNFLINNPYLVLDTKFFNKKFKEELIESLHDLDTKIDGILINSDNFHALNLLEEKYKKKIDCVYIDPPYNSPSSEIMYKNNFKHSSWLTLMENRLELSKKLINDKHSYIIAIDKYEFDNLYQLVKEKFPYNDNVCISIEHNKKGTQGNHFSYSNEFAIFSISNSIKKINEKKREEKNWEFSNLRNWGSESERKHAKNCFYPIYIKNDKIIGYGDVSDENYHPKNSNIKIKPGKISCYLNEELIEVISTEDEPVIAVYPIDNQGIERKWRYAFSTIKDIWNYIRIQEGNAGEKQIFLTKYSDQYKTLWTDSNYNAGDFGTKILTSMGISKEMFQFPKSLYTVQECINVTQDKNTIVLDYFAGSGTTGHAIIDFNRKDNGNRKYILVEMGEYFNTVVKPRIQKVIYSKEWDNGKPIKREGVSHIFKYIVLESYEDSLNNIRFDTEISKLLPDNSSLLNDFMISYMLSMESKNSKSMLNIDLLKDPFNYKMEIIENGEIKIKTIDLIETFNYLIGLTISRNFSVQAFDAEFLESEYGQLEAKLINGDKYNFKVVNGFLPNGDKTIIIWRNMTEDRKKDNIVLNSFIKKLNIELNDFRIIYVNGDNFIKNLFYDKELNIHLIEEIMKSKIFNGGI